MGHLPANTWGCSPWALTLLHLRDTWKAHEGTAGLATHVTLFVSPELWQVGSGEPEAQRLAPISGSPHPGLANSPAPFPTNWDRNGYRLLPALCLPKAPNPSAYSLGYSSIRHNAGSRRQREKTEDMCQLGWAGLGNSCNSGHPSASFGSLEPTEVSWHGLKWGVVVGDTVRMLADRT